MKPHDAVERRGTRAEPERVTGNRKVSKVDGRVAYRDCEAVHARCDGAVAVLRAGGVRLGGRAAAVAADSDASTRRATGPFGDAQGRLIVDARKLTSYEEIPHAVQVIIEDG